jgi:hypothetical protein
MVVKDCRRTFDQVRGRENVGVGPNSQNSRVWKDSLQVCISLITLFAGLISNNVYNTRCMFQTLNVSRCKVSLFTASRSPCVLLNSVMQASLNRLDFA